MKLSVIIKNKRLEQNLTQEQVACALGVSTPAVNKWEKGLSFPDITLLSPLARLLKVDLNTLLSFNQNLTDKEIGEFINEISAIIPTTSYENAFNISMEKIREYPTCHKLILNLAIFLKGALFMYNVTEKTCFEDRIDKLYRSCANSDDTEIKNQAISMLINNYLEEKNFDEAKAYIESLPTVTYDKNQLTGKLYMAKGETEKALELFSTEIIKHANEIYTALVFMMEMELKQENIEQAKLYAKTISEINKSLGLWEYNGYAAEMQLYMTLKDEDNLIKTLEKLIIAIKKPWDVSKTNLYKHIKKKENNEKEHQQFFNYFIDALSTDKDFEFVRDNEKFKELIAKNKEV